MQITITCKDGATGKEIAHQLRFQANLIEGMNPKSAAAQTTSDETEEMEVRTGPVTSVADDDDDEELAPTPTKKSAKADFDDEPATPDDDEGFDAPPKKTRAKKLTVDDVNDACKARAARTGGKEGRNEVFAILKKKFKTQSVSELKAEQYADVIAAMKA